VIRRRRRYNPPVHLLLPLVSSLLYVAAAMFVKQAADGGVGPWRTSFVCNWITAIIFLALLPFGGTIPGPVQFYQPAVVALLFVGGQLLTFLALDKGDVSVATPVMGVKVILVAVFTIAFTGQTVRWQPSAARPLRGDVEAVWRANPLSGSNPGLRKQAVATLTTRPKMTTSTTKKEQVPKMTLSCDAGCGNHSNKLLQCSGCHAVRYCDQTCQHNHWPQHKEACRKIAGR